MEPERPMVIDDSADNRITPREVMVGNHNINELVARIDKIEQRLDYFAGDFETESERDTGIRRDNDTKA